MKIKFKVVGANSALESLVGEVGHLGKTYEYVYDYDFDCDCHQDEKL